VDEDEAQEPQPGERRLNIHLDPADIAGVYANFANISFSRYEFTLTFARIEHEVEAEVHAAIASAKRAGFADIREVIASNWSGEYASVVTRFTHSVTPSFGGGQSEARPGPF